MNRVVLCTLLGTFVTLGINVSVRADDTNSDRPVMTPKQMMQECMTKARQENSGASEDSLKKMCQEKIASYQKHPSETAEPPNNR
jgi:hypothetical protein